MVRHYVKAGSPTPTTASTSQNDHSSRRSVLYIKNVLEETARIHCKHEMQVGNKTGGTFPQLLMQPRVDVGETNITLSAGRAATIDHFSFLGACGLNWSQLCLWKENVWWRGPCIRDHRQSCVFVKYTRTDAPMDEVPRNNHAWKVGGTRGQQGLQLKQQSINHQTFLLPLNLTVPF